VRVCCFVTVSYQIFERENVESKCVRFQWKFKQLISILLPAVHWTFKTSHGRHSDINDLLQIKKHTTAIQAASSSMKLTFF
jgi:hypothetical protein